MSFNAFLATVDSEALKSVARHWDAVREGRRMPGWTDIQPSAIRAQLPIVWAWRFEARSNEFIGRLAGDRIQRVFGANFRGARMHDVFPADQYARIFERHKRVMAEPAFFRGHGLVFRHLDRFDMGERIILPLGEDGESGDGILGATDFVSYRGMPTDEVLRTGEIEAWFALE